jgi:hypothetical protein
MQNPKSESGSGAIYSREGIISILYHRAVSKGEWAFFRETFWRLKRGFRSREELQERCSVLLGQGVGLEFDLNQDLLHLLLLT